MTDNETQPHSLPESEIIRLVEETLPASHPDLAVGIGDDAAVIEYGARGELKQVVTSDLLVEGMHFDLRYMSLADAGWKALAVNISDIAAMGAQPKWAVGSLGVPPGIGKAEIELLLGGIAECAGSYSITMAGGDTVAAPQWCIGFTVAGELSGAPLLRSSAKPGDVIMHTGKLGLSQIALHILWGGEVIQDGLARTHTRPQPQVSLGLDLQRQNPHMACIDLSDSLSKCVLQLCEASGVSAQLDFSGYSFDSHVIDFARRFGCQPSQGFGIPGANCPGGKAMEFGSLAEFLLASSEDYQLLFAADRKTAGDLQDSFPGEFTLLGTVGSQDEPNTYLDEDGRKHSFETSGWQHF